MTKKEYQKYLRSKDWIERRKILVDKWKNECCFCGSKEDLNLHHLNYDSLGKETIFDVALLCKGCHYKVHKKKLLLWFMTDKEFEAYQTIKHLIVESNAFELRIFIKRGSNIYG